MEQTPQPPERHNPLLEQAELDGLFRAITNVLITKGEYRPDPSAYIPEGQPESLLFRIGVDPWLVKAIFYPDDDMVEIVGDYFDTFLSYATPHVLDIDAPDAQYSNVYLEFNGRLQGTDITFQETHRIAVGEVTSGIYTGSIEREYECAGRLVNQEAIEINGMLMMVSSEYRDIRLEDAQKLRRLLDHL